MIKTTCRQDPTVWHRYWAWFPKDFYEKRGDRICRTRVWLDYVERRGEGRGGYDGVYWVWEYRMIKKSNATS